LSLSFGTWQRPDRGALFVVTGASGTGKTTLVRRALQVVPHLRWSVSATTRPPRPGEVDGRDYWFVESSKFDELVSTGSLLEWAVVYGNRYGTPRAPVEQALAQGDSIVLEIDTQGAGQVRDAAREAVTIFILPPTVEAIAARLHARSSDPPAVVARRIADARIQLDDCGRFDYLVMNDDLEAAHDQFQAILVAELRRRSRLNSWVHRFTR
jgi:guanylate kinase